jgi:tRNA(Ile2) C34 agmatinyltransferase TiaS
MTEKNTSILKTELVTGHCPSCTKNTILVGLHRSFYRCTNCGEDIEQKVNGIIRYMKVDKDTQMKLRELDDTRG